MLFIDPFSYDELCYVKPLEVLGCEQGDADQDWARHVLLWGVEHSVLKIRADLFIYSIHVWFLRLTQEIGG